VCAAFAGPLPAWPVVENFPREITMNDSASGLSKILLQGIPRDFSKFSPRWKIHPFFRAIAFPFIAFASFGYVREFGNYTALVFYVSGTTGMALVEVYDESAFS
jgi:hypothetical protein